MFKYQALVILLLVIWFVPTTSYAQETDPYEEYSHLWEDTSKKKKKNKVLP